MFRELADFEGHHRERLTALKESLRSGGSWIRYGGRELSKIPAEGGARKAVGSTAGALEALQLAIAAEETAEARYREIAATIEDEKGRSMFERLAAEEALHRRLLDDQYYALANRGEWVWGD
jgi:rubrerythrin